MKDNFAACLSLTLQYEGLWSDNPHDPGGATMRGVTLKTFSAFKGRQMTKDELRHIADDDLHAIYRVGYWDKMHCDDLPSGVDMVAFDAAVNSGPKRAAQWLQQAAGVAQDGAIGPKTFAAIRAENPRALINAALDARMTFLKGLTTYGIFGRGWAARVANLRSAAVAMA